MSTAFGSAPQNIQETEEIRPQLFSWDNRMFCEGSPEFLHYGQKSSGLYNDIRLIPAVDASGNVEEPFNPAYKAVAGSTDYSKMLGSAFATLDVYDLTVKNEPTRLTFIANCFNDRDGNPVSNWVKGCNEGPFQTAATRISWKMYAIASLRNKGYECDAPAAWERFIEKQDEWSRKLWRPNKSTFAQCLTIAKAGQPLGNMAKEQAMPGYVTWFPAVALNNLLARLRESRLNEDDCVSLATIDPNMDVIGCQNGRALRIIRNDSNQSSDKDAKGKVGYNIVERRQFPINEDQVREWWTPWERVFNIMTVEEQVHLVGELFGEEGIDYGFRNSRTFSKYIPKDIKGAAASIEDERRKKVEIEAIPVNTNKGKTFVSQSTQTSVPVQQKTVASIRPAAPNQTVQSTIRTQVNRPSPTQNIEVIDVDTPVDASETGEEDIPMTFVGKQTVAPAPKQTVDEKVSAGYNSAHASLQAKAKALLQNQKR